MTKTQLIEMLETLPDDTTVVTRRHEDEHECFLFNVIYDLNNRKVELIFNVCH